jgi:hypothetical protein
MKQLDLTVKVDLQRPGPLPSMEVDLVGVKPDEYEALSRQFMDEYWYAQSPARSKWKGSTKTLSFGGETHTQRVTKKDAIWKTWKEQGAKILPLEQYRWNSDKIAVTIFPTGATVAPAMNPEKK